MMPIINFFDSDKGSGALSQHQRLLVCNQVAAEMLSISERHLFDLVLRGEIKVVKSGRKNLFSIQSLTRWIDSKLENSPKN